MKVGLIVDYLSVEKGTGIARYSQQILNGLRKEGVDVEVISLKSSSIPFGEAFNHAVRLPYYILKRARNFDLIHATAPITGLCFPLLKKPKVVTYHDIGSYIHEDSASSFHVKISAPFFYKIGKYADKIIADSSQTKDELIKYMGFPEEKIAVVNLGIGQEFKLFEKKKENDIFTIGFVGALTKRKRVDYAIKAIHFLIMKYRNIKVKFFIYGIGEDFQRLKDIVESLELGDTIEFKGFAADEKLVEIYNSFDAFILPSDWEGFGIPVLEAQKSGVPVIIREDVHIPREVSKHCVKARSEEDMANKIYELLTNPSFKKHVVKKGLEYSKQFTWEKTAEETLKVYELISEGK